MEGLLRTIFKISIFSKIGLGCAPICLNSPSHKLQQLNAFCYMDLCDTCDVSPAANDPTGTSMRLLPCQEHCPLVLIVGEKAPGDVHWRLESLGQTLFYMGSQIRDLPWSRISYVMTYISMSTFFWYSAPALQLMGFGNLWKTSEGPSRNAMA